MEAEMYKKLDSTIDTLTLNNRVLKAFSSNKLASRGYLPISKVIDIYRLHEALSGNVFKCQGLIRLRNLGKLSFKKVQQSLSDQGLPSLENSAMTVDEFDRDSTANTDKVRALLFKPLLREMFQLYIDSSINPRRFHPLFERLKTDARTHGVSDEEFMEAWNPELDEFSQALAALNKNE